MHNLSDFAGLIPSLRKYLPFTSTPRTHGLKRLTTTSIVAQSVAAWLFVSLSNFTAAKVLKLNLVRAAQTISSAAIRIKSDSLSLDGRYWTIAKFDSCAANFSGAGHSDKTLLVFHKPMLTFEGFCFLLFLTPFTLSTAFLHQSHYARLFVST